MNNRMVAAAIAAIQCGLATAPHTRNNKALPSDRPGNSNVPPSTSSLAGMADEAIAQTLLPRAYRATYVVTQGAAQDAPTNIVR
jgi:hypothetical protein